MHCPIGAFVCTVTPGTGTDENDEDREATEMEDFSSASAEISDSSPAVSEPNRDLSSGQSRVRGMFELVNHHTQLQQALFSFLPEQMRSTQALAWLLSQPEHHQDAVSLMEAMMKVRHTALHIFVSPEDLPMPPVQRSL
jgi:hypothetical protein